MKGREGRGEGKNVKVREVGGIWLTSKFWRGAPYGTNQQTNIAILTGWGNNSQTCDAVSLWRPAKCTITY